MTAKNALSQGLKSMVLAVFVTTIPTATSWAAEEPKPDAPPPVPREQPREGVGERPRPRVLMEVPPREDARRAAGELEDRLRLMEMEVRELRKQGNHDEAARMERQMGEIRQRLGTIRERGGMEGQRPFTVREGQRQDGPPPQERRRMQARMAIEQLRAAGLPELAEQVEREATAKLGELPKAPEGGMEAGQAERMERLEMQMRELRDQMRMMQRRLMPPER